MQFFINQSVVILSEKFVRKASPRDRLNIT